MARMKLVLLGLVAVLGISAVASASAFAECGTGCTRYFVEKTELAGEDKAEATVETAQLNSEVAGVKIMIVCTKNKFSEGKIKEKGESSGKIQFEGCKVYEIKNGVLTLLGNCTVKEPIEFNFKDQLVVGPGGMGEDEFKPSSGTTFVVIKIEGSLCAIKKEYKTEGSYVASAGDEGERELVEHELIFTSNGSKVTFEGKQASFTNRTKIKVEGSKPYYIG
jgi:hypothetical protein